MAHSRAVGAGEAGGDSVGMPCAAVAVIGWKNNPLYVRTLVDPAGVAADASTHLHYIVHAALDVIEERGERHLANVGSEMS